MSVRVQSLVLTRAEIAALMTRADCLEAVEDAFRAAKEGRANAPAPMHLPASGGGFHAKGANYRNRRAYAALKLNGNFPGNPARHGLPTIQGAILLCDAENGALLAVMDSIEITLRRTAAASALAARHLARPDSTTALICGCGAQARAHVPALTGVLPLGRFLAWDIDPSAARSFAEEVSGAHGVEAHVALSLSEAARASDVIVTCTTAREPFLAREHISPGTFIAAVGADSPEKNEIAPELMAAARIVADAAAQCEVMGDLRHARAAGAIDAERPIPELGDILVGGAPGRADAEEITLFDSTGTALQDAASAAIVYEHAVARGAGARFDFGAVNPGS
jgi:ornithine cyclodeaminase/alanine dehydrogenase-like protein (mu-crystallin family)